jgi:hypothetical protein
MILDTNGLSAMADGDRAIESALLSTPRLAVPVVVLGEYRYGIRQSRGRMEYERWLAESILLMRVLTLDAITSEQMPSLPNTTQLFGMNSDLRASRSRQTISGLPPWYANTQCPY